MRIMTIHEVSARTRIPEGTLRYYRHRADGTGPRSFKLGGRVMYLEEDVDVWVRAQYEETQAA